MLRLLHNIEREGTSDALHQLTGWLLTRFLHRVYLAGNSLA